MYKRLLLSSLFAVSFSYSMSIDDVVKNTLNNNYDLKSLEKSIEIANEEIRISKNWENPVLSIGANDIWFEQTFSRDKEAMQAQFIGFTQTLPIGDKLEIKENIAKQDKKIQSLMLEDKKLQLESKISEYAYTILVLEKKEELLNSYEKNIKKLEKLYIALSNYGKIKQNEILNVQISYENISLEKQNLQTLIKNLYLKLEQISYMKIDDIEATLDIKKVDLLADVESHPKILAQFEKSKKYEELSDLEKSKKIPDIKVNATYFQRDDRFKDYANISVSIPLPLYNTEDINALKAKIEANKVNDEIIVLKQNFISEISILENNINNAYNNYELFQKRIIPLKQRVQKYLESYNSFDQVKPQESIKNLNELITFELKSLDEIQKYFVNLSQSKYFTKKEDK